MARVINVEDVPMVERPNIREGTLRSRRLLTGEPGTPGNFSLQLSSTPTYFSPRHRHNFDQVRYQLSGDFDFSTDGAMKPGSVAYFPEGTYYGPQSCPTGSETLVLQFGGASRSGYHFRRATRAGVCRTREARNVCEGRIHAPQARWQQDQQGRLRSRVGTGERTSARVSRPALSASCFHGP